MMQSKVLLHIRNPFLLDASTYVSTAVMALLGISGLDSLALQITALILCLIFVLLYRFLFRTGHYERNPVIYFGIQAVVLLLLLLLHSDTGDAFTFLFYILTVHAAVVFTVPVAALWVSFYYVIASVVELLERGVDGLYAIFFYLAAFIVCAIFGHTVQQTELTSERNQRLVEELQSTQQKLQALAVLEERNRLARDLHDSVKQQVFAISMQLSAARTALTEADKAYASVVQAEKLAQQAGAELTTLIHQLRPPGLEHKSLAEAIKEQVHDWSRQNDIKVTLNVNDVPAGLNVEQALFRVLQEALANAARHSQATQVEVTLNFSDHLIVLTVEDNGIGYDMEQIAKGVGLDSMRERLAAVNGNLEISSLPSRGTCVTASVKRS